MVNDIQDFEPALRKLADYEVDTTRSVDEVVSEVLRVIESSSKTPTEPGGARGMNKPDGPSLGLKRGQVALHRSEPSWPAEAAREIAFIRTAFEGAAIDVQHVGSTAVAGLASKPIIDIAVALRSPVVEADAVTRLSGAGYTFRGDKGTKGGLLFVRTDENDVRTVHVHVVAGGSVEWRNYMRFRDVLRRDARARDAYEIVKREAAARFPNDRAAYGAAKHDFIEQTLRE